MMLINKFNVDMMTLYSHIYLFIISLWIVIGLILYPSYFINILFCYLILMSKLIFIFIVLILYEYIEVELFIEIIIVGFCV